MSLRCPKTGHQLTPRVPNVHAVVISGQPEMIVAIAYSALADIPDEDSVRNRNITNIPEGAAIFHRAHVVGQGVRATLVPDKPIRFWMTQADLEKYAPEILAAFFAQT